MLKYTFENGMLDVSTIQSQIEMNERKWYIYNELEDFIETTIRDFKRSTKGWRNLRILIRGIFKYVKRQKYMNISITQFFGDLELSRKIFSN